MQGVDRTNAASWIAVAVALTGVLAYTAANHQGLTAHVQHPSPSPTSTASHPADPAPLTPALSFRVDADTARRETTYTFTATNSGDQTLTVTSATSVAPRARTTVTATYRVTDCALVTRATWPLPVTFLSGGNRATQLLSLGSTSPDTPWQAAAADAVCHPQSPTP